MLHPTIDIEEGQYVYYSQQPVKKNIISQHRKSAIKKCGYYGIVCTVYSSGIGAILTLVYYCYYAPGVPPH